MIENQFIYFTNKESAMKDDSIPVPVVFGGRGISFFITNWAQPIDLSLTRANGEPIMTVEGFRHSGGFIKGLFGDFTYDQLRTKEYAFPSKDVKVPIAMDECFRLAFKHPGIQDQYSNLLRLSSTEGLSYVEYGCKDFTFGIPFKSNDMGCTNKIRLWLPVHVSNPEYNQKDNIYEKLSGEKVVLFASINREYECESDYIPDDWHHKLVVALSCDETFINEEKLTKSDKYEIDWENNLKLDNGVKCAKATWKMAQNVTQRNSI